jgi:hypothetical protein
MRRSELADWIAFATSGVSQNAWMVTRGTGAITRSSASFKSGMILGLRDAR